MADNPPKNPERMRNWTVMVYMAAGDSHQLDTVAVRDLKEMEQGCNPNVNVVVQINRHWPDAAQRYEIQKDHSRFIEQLPAETDMGKGSTLADFVTWVARSPDYAADNYCLVLWGHAYGLGFGRDHKDPLQLREIRAALEQFKKERRHRREGSDGRLEILGTNACAMSYVEAAFEFRDVAALMVASQITVPFSGWPYDVILGRIGAATSIQELAVLISDAYVTQFDDLPGGDKLAMTVLNLDEANGFEGRLEALAKTVSDVIKASRFDTETLATLRDVFTGAAAGDVRPLVDLTTLCRTLIAESGQPETSPIVMAAEVLLSDLQLRQDRKAKPGFRERVLVAYHRAHPELDDLNGIGVYTPFVTDDGILDRLELREQDGAVRGRQPRRKDAKKEYEGLQIFTTVARDGFASWPSLVYDELRRTIPADLMIAIDGIGALQTGDRADVAQIIMGVESAINRMDRTVAKAKRDIVSALGTQVAAAGFEAASASGSGGRTMARSLGAPWLRLLPLPTVAELREFKALAELTGSPINAPNPFSANGTAQPVVEVAIDRFGAIERSLSEVERVIRRGLTHARFGLGPMNPTRLGFGPEQPKAGGGPEHPKAGGGPENPKAGGGPEHPKAGGGPPLLNGNQSLDLRGDLALDRVADLFRQVGDSLRALEEAATNVELSARMMLIVGPALATHHVDPNAVARVELERSFLLLEEASADTRRTLRRVLVHPVYGLGPGEEALTFDVRQDLALSGGLDRRHLKLL